MAQAVINRPGVERGSTTTCYSCGKWPACGYRDLDRKHLGRICEDCLAASKVEAKG